MSQQEVKTNAIPKIPAPKLPPAEALEMQPRTGLVSPIEEPVPQAPASQHPPRPTIDNTKPEPVAEDPEVHEDPADQEPDEEKCPSLEELRQRSDPATASLLAKLLDSHRRSDQRFFLVVIPEDSWPRLESFTSVDALVSHIKQLLGQNCHVFPFLGYALPITKGPNRFLHTPFGHIPLFDIPEPDKTAPAEYGWIGDEELPESE